MIPFERHEAIMNLLREKKYVRNMLVTLKEILSYAEANKCAIGAFHILSEDNLTAVLDAAQELNFPVIIMHSQENEKKLPLANIENSSKVIFTQDVECADGTFIGFCITQDFFQCN